MSKCSLPSPPGSDLQQALAEHEGLLHWVVRRQWRGDLSDAEALHLGRIALWQALQRYDPNRGVRFSTYAVPAIARAIWRAVAQERPDPHQTLMAQPPAASPDPAEVVEQAALSDALRTAVASLPPRLQAVIVLAIRPSGRDGREGEARHGSAWCFGDSSQ